MLINKICRKLDKRRRLILKNPFYFCDLIFTSPILHMKPAKAIYLMFTAILFLLQHIVYLYCDIAEGLIKPTLKACKLLRAGNFIKWQIPAQTAGMVIIPPCNMVKAIIHDNRSVALHKRVMLSVNITVLLALWVFAVFWPNQHYLNPKNQGGFVAKQALRFDRMLTAF